MIVVTRKELLAQYGTNKNKATKRNQTGFKYFSCPFCERYVNNRPVLQQTCLLA